MSEKVIIHTDGGARNNPGPAAIGAVIEFDGKKNKFGEAIGRATNNEAEYAALVFALEKTRKLLGKKKAREAHLICHADSELMVKQLNHQYKLKNEGVQKAFLQIWNLMLDFDQVEFHHVRREKNQEADALVNQALDREKSKLF